MKPAARCGRQLRRYRPLRYEYRPDADLSQDWEVKEPFLPRSQRGSRADLVLTRPVSAPCRRQTPDARAERRATAGPFTREPPAVLDDVLDGYISENLAWQRYGVVIVDGRLDEAATARLRAGQWKGREPRVHAG